MKLITLVLLFTMSFNSFSGTCTSISRTAYSTQEILTSAALNADFDQLVTGHNVFDLGCSTAETLEADALNQNSTVGFDVMLNTLKEGCDLTVSTTTALLSTCRIAVDGNLIKSSTTLEVTWSDIDTGSEATNTNYYWYAKSGASLDVEISTSTPNALGFNGTSRIIGQFYNDSTGNIATYSVYPWHIDNFKGEKQANIPINAASAKQNWIQCPFILTPGGDLRSMGTGCVESVTATVAGERRVDFKSATFKDFPICTGLAGGGGHYISISATDSSYEYITFNIKTDAGATSDQEVYMNCVGVGYP